MAAHIYAAKAFDNHAHPVLPPPNDRTDRDFDALPVDNMEPATDVVAWRADNPQLPAAWKVLWNYDAPASFLAPLNADAMKRLAAARAAVQAREGPRSRSSTILACDIPTLLYYMVAGRLSVRPALCCKSRMSSSISRSSPHLSAAHNGYMAARMARNLSRERFVRYGWLCALRCRGMGRIYMDCQPQRASGSCARFEWNGTGW